MINFIKIKAPHLARKLLYSMSAAFFCYYVVFTILYLAPLNPLSKYYKPFINNFFPRIFSQNWKLFAPDPLPYSFKFLIKCDGANTWGDPFLKTQKEHYANRFSHTGKILYIYNGLIMDAYNYTVKKCNQKNRGKCIFPLEILSDGILPDPYRRVKNVATRSCGNKASLIRLGKLYVSKFSERADKTKKRKFSFYEYKVN